MTIQKRIVVDLLGQIRDKHTAGELVDLLSRFPRDAKIVKKDAIAGAHSIDLVYLETVEQARTRIRAEIAALQDQLENSGADEGYEDFRGQHKRLFATGEEGP